MRIAAAAARRKPLPALLEEVLSTVQARLEGQVPHLAFVFFSNHFEDDGEQISEYIREKLGPRVLAGCSAEAVIGPEHEHEEEPVVSLWAAVLPEGAHCQPFQFLQSDLEAAPTPAELRKLFGRIPDGVQPTLLTLGDPFSVDITELLQRLNDDLPGWTAIGGMASGAERPEQSSLLLNGTVQREGIVGAALWGNLRIDTAVSQGCRPIGKPFIITKAERNIIWQLGGKSPLSLLNQIFEEAEPAEKKLMQQGIFLGRAIKEGKEEFRQGDFLIRNLMQADQGTGGIAIADLMRVGVTVQFHVRDAGTADEDLKTLVRPLAVQPPEGALLFSCNGRGTRMFPEKDHDIGVLRHFLPGLPAAGFFCAGELGPVGGKNFIHGHTASVAFFRPAGSP
jgi:small ligand-binding sensory domain FIST